MARNIIAAKKEKTLNNEVITPENLSVEILREALEAAHMNIIDDDPPCLMIEEGVTLIIAPDLELRNRISISTALKFKKGHTMNDYLDCVNTINLGCIFIKSAVLDRDDPHLALTLDLMIDGGLTKKNFILTVRQFSSTALQIYLDREHIVG